MTDAGRVSPSWRRASLSWPDKRDRAARRGGLFAEVPAEQLPRGVRLRWSSSSASTMLCTITGLDERRDPRPCIYHLARDDGVVLNLSDQRAARRTRSLQTVTDRFPGGRRLRARAGRPAGHRGRGPAARATATRCPTTGPRASTRCARTGSPTMLRRTPTDGGGGEPWLSVTIPIGPQHPALKEPESFTHHARGREDHRRSTCAWATTTAASRRPARSAPTSRTST